MDELKAHHVSFVFVTDPFGEFDLDQLSRFCRQRPKRYKDHYVTDLRRDPKDYRSNHHRRNVEKAKRLASIEVCDHSNEADWKEAWSSLYRNLARRHSIEGEADGSALEGLDFSGSCLQQG